MQYYFRFSTKNDFLYLLFLKIWVKPHFPLKRPSLFSSRAEVFLSRIKKNKKLSSENSNSFLDDPSDRSLIYIKNNNGSSDALGNTCFNIRQVRDFPFIKTLGFSFLRKSQRFSELLDIPFAFSLKIGPLFQTLSNIFDRKIPLTLKSSWNTFYIAWVIAKRWFMLEFSILNPEWLGEISLFSINNLNISLKISFSKFFPQIGSRDAGR